jgi:hypothetical protein
MWSASRPGRFTPGERAAGTHWIRGWVCPRADLDTVEKKKSYPCQESIPGRPGSSPSLYRLIIIIIIIIIIIMTFFIYVFTCVLNRPKANYNVSTSKETYKTNTCTQKTKQGNVYHLANNQSISAIMGTMMRWEEVYIYILILHTVNILIINC